MIILVFSKNMAYVNLNFDIIDFFDFFFQHKIVTK